MHLELTQALVSSFVVAALTAAAQPVGQTTDVAIPIVKRLGLVNVSESANIEELNSQVESVKAKILGGLSNFEKNTGFKHPSALNESQKLTVGASHLTGYNEQLWYGTISVGDPPKSFTVDFDTASSDLFLPGPYCHSNCAGHTAYIPSHSSSSQNLHLPFRVSYGNVSSASGDQYSDTVTIAGLAAKKQVFGVASQYSINLGVQQFPSDGLMGMAFPQIGYTQSPVFQSLVRQEQTNKPVFSFKLTASGAELYLGGANTELYTGDFSYTPVIYKAFWEVNLGNIKGNGQTIMRNVDCIIDTGTTLIVGIPSQVARLHKALGGTDASRTVGAGFYTCSPSGGRSFPILPDTLNFRPVSPGSSDCVSGIVGRDIGASIWVVGDVFLQNVYTTFDLGKSRVGFAQLA